MRGEKKKSKLKIIIPIIVIAIVAIVFFIVKAKTENEIYEIGETVKTKDWEITLLDVQYGKQRSTSLSHEDFLLPEDNSTVTLPYYESVKQGNTAVIITYNIKFLGKADTYLMAGFKLDFDNGYIIEDNTDMIPSLYIRNNIQEESSQSLWEIKNSSYEFQPYSNELKIREYIVIPDNVANDTEKPLILMKGLRKAGSPFTNSGKIIKYKLK